MVQTVTARPSHYDVLGVAPGASSDEIVRAFAREMSKPRAFGGLADVSIAYEVLRNPERRRAYDASIAPERKPEPDPQAEPVRRPHALHARPHFIAAALPEVGAAGVPEPIVEERKLEIAPIDKANKPSLPPFFANALREIADPAPLSKADTPPTAPRRREINSEDAPAPIPRVMIEPMFSEEGVAPWKRIAIPAGGAILAMAIIGAWAGSRGKTEPSIDAKAETALIAPPTTFDVRDPAADTPAKVADDVPPPPVETAVPLHRTTRTTHLAKAKPPSQLADLDQQLAEPAPGPAAEQAPATDAPKTIAPSMPLPNSVIARTIGRIGYPCGSVASTTAGGAPGVFTITCTSGHSYKAAPVHGRYRFSKVRG